MIRYERMLSSAQFRRSDRGTRPTDARAGSEVLMEATKYCSLGQLTGASPERSRRTRCGGSIGGICRYVTYRA
jgi:hypothetical protein